jgi:hypothetical protein
MLRQTGIGENLRQLSPEFGDRQQVTMNPNYIWTYRIDVKPYDKLIDVLEAFFVSYPNGDYACERREKYKLHFRRGQWRKSMMGLGQLVPDRLAKGRFELWPTMVRVMVRPSPDQFAITVHYELYLPKELSRLNQAIQTSVDQHARKELTELADYLGTCIDIKPPEVINTSD